MSGPQVGPPTAVALWIQAARPKTLPAAASPVLLGIAFAISTGGFHLAAALCAFLSAMLIQVGTNFANDYQDFVRGADTYARKGPRRATQSGVITVAAMKRATVLAFGLAFVAGLYLVIRGGLPILIVGVASIAAGIAYTAGRYALAYTGMADLFVLLFFGPVAVGGTYFVQALAIESQIVVAGLGPGFLATAILLANNVRDIDEDRAARKRTLVVRFGRSFGVGLYGACIVSAALIPILLVTAADGSIATLAASLVALGWGIPLTNRLRNTDDAARHNQLLARTAQLLLLYGVFFGAGLQIG